MSIVNVQKDNRYTVEPLYQWDVNQVLEIRGLSLPSIPSIHFTNEAMDKAIVRQAAMDDAGVITVNVPNSLLQKPYKIKAYVCIYEGETFETLYKIEIPVNARKKPADYTIEDDQEVYSFNALENSVNNAVNNLTIKLESAMDAVEILNDRIYLIEKGTKNGVTYEKWSDGTVKMWGIGTVEFESSTLLGLKEAIPLPIKLLYEPYLVFTNYITAPWPMRASYNKTIYHNLYRAEQVLELAVYSEESDFSSDVLSSADIGFLIIGKWQSE